MAKVWVLDTDTKGTGAHMVPLEDVLEKPKPEAQPRRTPRSRPRPAGSPPKRPPARPAQPVERTSTALPAGHVRKKSTGEIGRVRAVDPRAGTATVHWLKQGRTSTVPLSAISRY
jgi:hypothetical protein